MLRTILFDDQGEMWDANSPHLAESLHASLYGEDLLKYVVRNLGFVAVTENSGSLRLRLRPSIVSQTALSGLLYWLHDQTIERVMISLLDGDWSHELVRTREGVVRRLLAHVKVNLEDRRGDFLNRPRPLHALERSSPLRGLLDAWADCNGKYDAERLRPVIEKAVNGRFVLVEASPSAPGLFIKDVGGGLTNTGKYWLSRSIGLRVEDQPDYAYGKWVAEPYRQVLNTGEPNLEDVDAVITWPGNPRRSYRYRRLVVPFNSAPDSTLLLGVTLVDPNIDLRVKPRQEPA
jgi:hypothetical protein